MSELYDLFRRNFPFCVREEKLARQLLDDSGNVILWQQDDRGRLIGAAVVQENNILMLCVDEEFRKNGIGSRLLAEAEERIRKNGYQKVTVGAGKEYLMPGVPVNRPVIEEALEAGCVYEGLGDEAMRFFENRGYAHSWDCNCFDMRFELNEFLMPGISDDGLEYRWAGVSDRPSVLECVQNGFEKFVRHYDRDELYREDARSRVLIAVDEEIVAGALIVSLETEGEGIGSVGCTVVRESHQGRGIASKLVITGTAGLREAGMRSAFLG